MSNILTDILGFFKRRKFVKKADPNDVLIIGLNQEPDMLGVASPTPYKDAKLIRVKDLIASSDECLFQNIGSGLEVYSGKTIVSGQCYQNFRSLKSVSLNLNINQVGDEIQFNTSGEPNIGANVGTGARVYKNKVGEELRFRTLVSSDNSIDIDENADEIDFSSSITGLNIGSSEYPMTGIFKQKTDAELEFYSLVSSDGSVDIDLITQDNVIDLTVDPCTWTASDGKSQTEVDCGDIIKFEGGDKIAVAVDDANKTIEFDHETTSRSDTTSTDSPGSGGTFTAIDTVTTDSFGHVTDVNTKTITLPESGSGSQLLWTTTLEYNDESDPAGFGSYNLPNVIANIPTDNLLMTSFQSATGSQIFACASNNQHIWGTYGDNDFIRVTYEGLVEGNSSAEVPGPYVVYLGLHNNYVGATNATMEYGWQAVGIPMGPGSNGERELCFVRCSWEFKALDVKQPDGTPIAPGNTNARFDIHSGATISGCKMLFGKEWKGVNIPDGGGVFPGPARMYVEHFNMPTNLNVNPYSRS